MQELIPSLLAFVVTSSVVYGILDAITYRGRVLNQRVGAAIVGSTSTSSQPPRPGTPLRMDILTDAINQKTVRPDLFPWLTALLNRSELGKDLRLAMIRAGLLLRPSEFLLLAVFSTAIFAVLGDVCTHQVLMVILLAIIGLLIPVAWLVARQASRRAKFDAQLPDALTLITSSIRSGYSFMRAMQMVNEEMPVPISEEFGWALVEAQMGVPTETALQRMVGRVRSYDLDLAVTAISIQLQVGGNLAEILDTIASTIRDRVRMKRDINALTAEGRLSGVILVLLPIALGIIIDLKNPNFLEPLFTTMIGHFLIAGAIISQIAGALIIRRQVTFDV